MYAAIQLHNTDGRGQQVRMATPQRNAAPVPDVFWRAIVERDAGYADVLYYGVATTGVYCRVGCPSRRPRRRNVRVFFDGAQARAAGFRPCKRCEPETVAAGDGPHTTIVAACRYIEYRAGDPPRLNEIAKHVDVSPGHLQRTFKRALGVSPKQYADAVRLTAWRTAVREGDDIAGAMYGAGFGSSSRLYEGAKRKLGMTPATYRRGGAGETIRYATAETVLGRLLVAATERGVCSVRMGTSAKRLTADLRAEFHAASVQETDDGLGEWMRALVDYVNGAAGWPHVPVDVRATAFQARVWEALRTIPEGQTATYGEIAAAIGAPKSARAVARACASNPVALAIPCHRVVPKSGGAGGYRWGAKRKQTLLDTEARCVVTGYARTLGW